MKHVNAGLIALLLCASHIDVERAMAATLDQSAQAANEIQQPAHTVTGTLAVLDVFAGKGMLKTDLDKPIFFKIGRADHFQRLSIGDRVTMQLDNDGRSVKVIKALPSELHEPLPPATSP